MRLLLQRRVLKDYKSLTHAVVSINLVATAFIMRINLRTTDCKLSTRYKPPTQVRRGKSNEQTVGAAVKLRHFFI